MRDAVPDGRPGVGSGSGHATHVAGVIAAADDGTGVEGKNGD